MQNEHAKKVLLTGVTSGVGHALARMMKDRGYYVIVTCRNEEQAAILRAEKLFDSVVFADLGIIETVLSVPQQLRDQGVDQLDGFLHCAAISVASPIETVEIERVRHAFEVNVFGFLTLMQGLIEPLRKARGAARRHQDPHAGAARRRDERSARSTGRPRQGAVRQALRELYESHD